MTRHIITILLCLLASNAFAGKFWFQNPETPVIPANPVYLLHNKTTATDHTVTDTVLRNHMQPSTDETLTTISQPTDTPLVVRPAPTADQYQRKTEFHDKNGVIKMYINASGTVVITGQLVLGSAPVPLAVTSIFPAPGATGVTLDVIPSITLNKGAVLGLSTLYLQGNTTAPVVGDDSATWTIPAAPLSPNTTYTIKFHRNEIVQTDGETTSSCGPMTDVAGVCQSSFTTAP